MFSRYPYLSFDETKPTMIVQVAPSPLHESLGPILVDSISNAMKDLLDRIKTCLRTRNSQEYIVPG